MGPGPVQLQDINNDVIFLRPKAVERLGQIREIVFRQFPPSHDWALDEQFFSISADIHRD
jgi:hypothetical protein